jgi:hypothetical protein
MRSQIQPEASRLTMPKASISESICAPRAAPKPRSAQYATIWTCGIDIATQHATPAIDRSPSSALGDSPSGVALDLPESKASVDASGGRFASTKASGSMVAKQKTPTPVNVARQP